MEHNYLVHHGILGQKWGKKNGPPYPLAPGDHSSAEKRAMGKSKARKSSEMSDDELRTAIERKRLENRYNELSKKDVRKKQELAITAANIVDKVSKDDASTIKKSSKLAKDIVKTQKAAEKFEKNKAEKMSTDELKKAVKRLELEQEYDKLNPSGKDKIRVKSKDTLLVIDSLVGTAVTVTQLAKTPAGQKIIKNGKRFVQKIGLKKRAYF